MPTGSVSQVCGEQSIEKFCNQNKPSCFRMTTWSTLLHPFLIHPAFLCLLKFNSARFDDSSGVHGPLFTYAARADGRSWRDALLGDSVDARSSTGKSRRVSFGRRLTSARLPWARRFDFNRDYFSEGPMAQSAWKGLK